MARAWKMRSTGGEDPSPYFLLIDSCHTARTILGMPDMKRAPLLLLVLVPILTLFLARPVHAQVCYGPNDPNQQNPIPCPEDEKKKRKTPIPPTATFTATQTLTPSPTITPSPTPTPLLGLPFTAYGQVVPQSCVLPWLASVGGGLIALGMAAAFIRTTRSSLAAGEYNVRVQGYSGASSNYDASTTSSSAGGTTGTGYINPHEVDHAQLNSLDEYVETGLGRGLRIAGEGLLTSGGLLTAGGIMGLRGIIPCDAWPAATGLSLLAGFIISLLRSRRRRWLAEDPNIESPNIPDMDSDQSGMAEEKVEIREERTDEA